MRSRNARPPRGGAADGAAPTPGRRRARTLAALVIVAVGLALVSYPFVSDWLNRRAQNAVTTVQGDAVASAAPDALAAQREAAVSYNERLLQGSVRVADPFDEAGLPPGNAEYESVLDVAGDSVMAELIIPAINVDLPVSHYTSDESLSKGAGHLANTSVPIGGPSTHSVLAAHTGLPTARMFDRLDELRAGDWFVIRVLGEEHFYGVTATEVVEPGEVSSLAVQQGHDLVTLVTCTPYGVNSHRLLVHAERTGTPDQWGAGSGEPSGPAIADVRPGMWGAVAAGAACAVAIVGMAAGTRSLVRRRR